MTTYDDLLALDNKLKIHQRHLQCLAIEICESRNKLNPSFMWKTYAERNVSYSLSNGIPVINQGANTRKCGMNSLKFRASVSWNNLPVNLKEYQSLTRISGIIKAKWKLTMHLLIMYNLKSIHLSGSAY